MGMFLQLGLAGCDTWGQESPAPVFQPRDPATACRGLRGDYIAQADARRSFGDASGAVSVVLPGAHWCEVAEPPYGARFYRFSNLVALRNAQRPPTPSEYAHSFFLVVGGFGPSVIPAAALQDRGELRAQLEADLRAGLAAVEAGPAEPRLLMWDHGPRFRTIHGEVGATLPETNCVPTRIVYDETSNPRFPIGTVLRTTSVTRYCLAPGGSTTPVFAVLRASERRMANDPQADGRSAEWHDLVERFFASMRFGSTASDGDTPRD
jgi:hypothetical protein